jgi:hypothetical protein
MINEMDVCPRNDAQAKLYQIAKGKASKALQESNVLDNSLRKCHQGIAHSVYKHAHTINKFQLWTLANLIILSEELPE